VHDGDTGRLVNDSMLGFSVPTAADLPPMELLHTAVTSPVTPEAV
jgi:carbon-monoxide dehydrogenase large subunit